MLLGKFKVIGHSMTPFIKENDILLISSLPFLFKKPSLNDIVAFRVNNKIFIKRVKQIAGNKYLLIGDNRTDSLDSRKLGLIDKSNILGKVIYKFN